MKSIPASIRNAVGVLAVGGIVILGFVLFSNLPSSLKPFAAYPLPGTPAPSSAPQPATSTAQLVPTPSPTIRAAYPLPGTPTSQSTRNPAPTTIPPFFPTKDISLIRTPTPVRTIIFTPTPVVPNNLQIVQEIQVTNDGKAAFSSWSPDGRNILFTRATSKVIEYTGIEEAKGDKLIPIVKLGFTISELWTAQSDGTEAHLLATNANEASYSPSGTQIAYRVIPSNTQTEIWVMKSDGTNQTQLVSLGRPSPKSIGIGLIQWLTDKELVFEYDRHVQLLDVDSKQQTHLGSWTVDTGRSFLVNPQTRQLILIYGNTLSLVNTDGTVYAKLTDKATSGKFQPSPDGNWLAYVAGNQNNELWITDRSGSNPRQIANTAFINGLSWSSDSNSIAYFTSNEHEIEVANRVGGNARKIGVSPNANPYQSGLLWSPSDSDLVYVWGQRFEPGHLYATYANGSGAFPLSDAGGVYTSMPQWSPSYGQLAFTRSRIDTLDATDVWLVVVKQQ